MRSLFNWRILGLFAMLFMGAGVAVSTGGCGSGGADCYEYWDPYCGCWIEDCTYYYKPEMQKLEVPEAGYEWVARDDGGRAAVPIGDHLERTGDGRYKAVTEGYHLEWSDLDGDWIEVPDEGPY